MALNAHFLAKNHFFTLHPLNLATYTLITFSEKIFQKKFLVPLDPPWGTWGPYLRIGSVKYFPNVVF